MAGAASALICCSPEVQIASSLRKYGFLMQAAAGGADGVHDRLVDRLVVDVADERLGLQVAVGDHDGRRLVDVGAARDRLVAGDGLDPVRVDEDLVAVAVDVAELAADRLVVGGAVVVEEQHEHLALRDGACARPSGSARERLLGDGGGAAVWPVAGASAAGFVFTPVPVARGGRAGGGAGLGLGDRAAGGLRRRGRRRCRRRVTACWTAAPGLLFVVALGSLAGTGVVAAGGAAATASWPWAEGRASRRRRGR